MISFKQTISITEVFHFKALIILAEGFQNAPWELFAVHD